MSFPPIKPILLFSLCLFLLIGCKKSNSPSSGSTQTTEPPVPTAVGSPTGNAVSAVIGANGGSIKSGDGMTELIVPVGALSASTTISIQPITNNCPGAGLEAFRFGPNGLHFNQPVTLKIHYTDDELKSTLADLMGIAFQDSSGIWWRFKDFSNDSVGKVLTVSIKHFTDYAEFYMLHITPDYTSLAVDQSVSLQVEVYSADDVGLPPLPNSAPDPDLSIGPILLYKTNQSIWAVNGGLTDQDYGKITDGRGTLAATYKAPSTVPTGGNLVAVSATIDMGGMVFHGKKFNKTTLVSNIVIVAKKRSYYFKIVLTRHGSDPTETTGFSAEYTDVASFNFDILPVYGGPDTVRVYNCVNQPPTMDPTVGMDGVLTYTYVPAPFGLMNIIGGNGTALPQYGPGQVYIGVAVQISLIHTGATSPEWYVTGPGYTPGVVGGGPSGGYPLVVNFWEKNEVQMYDPIINGLAGEFMWTISPAN